MILSTTKGNSDVPNVFANRLPLFCLKSQRTFGLIFEWFYKIHAGLMTCEQCSDLSECFDLWFSSGSDPPAASLHVFQLRNTWFECLCLNEPSAGAMKSWWVESGALLSNQSTLPASVISITYPKLSTAILRNVSNERVRNPLSKFPG